MEIIYLRTSTELQNPENQLNDCLKLVSGEYKVIQDQQSAWKENDRVGFEEVKRLISSNTVKHLIVWDLDRIFRNRKRLIEFFEFAKIYKCKIHSFRQQWLESLNSIQEPFNEIMFNLMLQIMGWLAEEESSKKSERVKIAYQNHQGKKWGRPSIHTNKKKIVWDLRKQGLSMREISKQVKLSKSAVHKIIAELGV